MLGRPERGLGPERQALDSSLTSAVHSIPEKPALCPPEKWWEPENVGVAEGIEGENIHRAEVDRRNP